MVLTVRMLTVLVLSSGCGGEWRVVLTVWRMTVLVLTVLIDA